MVEDSLPKAIMELERAVGAKPGFFYALMREDDWSFVIKLHALVEAAVTHLLVIASGTDKLGDVYTLLELSDSRKGKLAFVRELDLLSDKYRRLIKTLSEIRNNLVHDIKNVGITLDDYVGKLDKQQRQSFIEAILLDFDSPIDIGGRNVPIREVLAENPKFGIWMAAMDLLASIYMAKEHFKMRGHYLRLTQTLAKTILGKDGELLNLKK